MTSNCLLVILLAWLPTGSDFQSEALDFLRKSDAKGVPLFDQFSFQKAEVQRAELRSDPRDWEGVIAEVLDPRTSLEGESAAISMLHVRDSFGDNRVTRSLKLLLDDRAQLAINAIGNSSTFSGQDSLFGNLVGNISRAGSPELLDYILQRLLQNGSGYNKIFEDRRIGLFLRDVGMKGSELHLPALNKLAEKLEAEGRGEASERARVAAITIKRRVEAEGGSKPVVFGPRKESDHRGTRPEGQAEDGVSSFVLKIIAGALVFLLSAGGITYMMKRPK